MSNFRKRKNLHRNKLVLALSFLFFASPLLANADDEIIGYWAFDEDAGQEAYDSSGYGNDGVIYGAERTVEGIHGNALLFDGRDDYVKIPHDDSLNAYRKLTVEAWFKGNGSDFSMVHRALPGGIPAGLPKVKVNGDKIYYVFNAGYPLCNVWSAVSEIDGSNWTSRQHTDSLRNDWQIKPQIVEDTMYLVWHTSGEWYGATMDLDGSNFTETKLSSGDHDHY